MNRKEPGSESWNDRMFLRHPTPYSGIAGMIQKYRVRNIERSIRHRTDGVEFTALEIGCGAGYLLQYITTAFPEAEVGGIDISSEALRVADTKLPDGVPLEQHDITEGPPNTPLGDVDIIVVSETLEHIPDVEDAVESIHQMAGPSTTVIVTVPIEKYKIAIKKALVKLGLFDLLFQNIERGSSEWHYHDFSSEKLRRLLSPIFNVKKEKNILLMHRILILEKNV